MKKLRKKSMEDMKSRKIIAAVLLGISLVIAGCEGKTEQPQNVESLKEVTKFSGEPFVSVNGNVPEFRDEDLQKESFESYSELDEMGRCGQAYANVGIETMPTEKRGSIGQVKPTGWQTVKYDNVDGKYLYNRCHLIGFQLTAENANEKNLITGTRYMNVDGMLPFENMVADYIKETKNHVLYRVTPIFKDKELVARGVQMEAKSVEDQGEGIEFNVFVYNNQPDIKIDYETGKSQKDKLEQSQGKEKYILNKKTKKFHDPSCSGVNTIKKENKKVYKGSREELIQEGYEPCKKCNP